MSSPGGCSRGDRDRRWLLRRAPFGQAPQRVAEANHRDAVGDGQEPVKGIGHQGENHAENSADCQERGRPAGENVYPEKRDAEEEATGQVCVASPAGSRFAAPQCQARVRALAVMVISTSLIWQLARNGRGAGRHSSQSLRRLALWQETEHGTVASRTGRPGQHQVAHLAEIHDRSHGYNGHQYALGLVCCQMAAKNDQDPFVVSRKGL